MKTLIEDLKEYTNLLPFLGAYFILYGSVDLITFYGQFNIAIVHYIGFTEIISYFIRDIYVVICHVLILFIAGILINYYREKAAVTLDNQKTNRQDQFGKADKIIETIDFNDIKLEDKEKLEALKSIIDPISDEIQQQKRRRKRIKYIIIVVLLLLIGKGIFLTFVIGWWMGFSLITSLIMSVVLSYFIHDFKLYLFLYALSTLLTSAYFRAIINADEIRNGKNYGINIKIDDIVIQSDSTNYVIGKTEKYLFYYKSKEKITTVYLVDNLNTMTIPNN